MNKFRNDLSQTTISVYLDGIIICSTDIKSHIKDLRKTFDRIKTFNLRLNGAKCNFCKPKVKCIGHILSKIGLIADPQEFKAAHFIFTNVFMVSSF